MSTAETGQMTEQYAQKNCLRMTLLGRRRDIKPIDRCIWDSDIGVRLLRMPEYQAADKLLVFMSTPWEVSTTIAVAHAIGMGKVVAIPRWDRGKMEFCRFTDYCDLTVGIKGILQPKADVEPIHNMDGALCIVPALAVDRQGRRIGYGGGYYDRFLSSFSGHSTTLAYDNMIMDSLPTEPHDLAVDSIITPSGIIRINKGDNL